MKDKERFTHGRNSVYNLNYHLIWGTKYRNNVLKGKIETDLKQLLHEHAIAKYLEDQRLKEMPNVKGIGTGQLAINNVVCHG